jgi:hypothetical protein
MIILVIKAPQKREAEKIFAIHSIFHHFFGINTEIEFQDRMNYELSLSGQSGVLFLPDIFFYQAEPLWLQMESMPKGCLKLAREQFPSSIQKSIYETDIAIPYSQQISHEEIDFIGNIFFILSTYEEQCISKFDQHGRFPVKESYFEQHGLNERPLVNELLELFWATLTQIWPNIGPERKTWTFTIQPTHDVDHAFYFANKSCSQALRIVAGDLLKRHSLLLAYQRMQRIIQTKKDYTKDPFWTFDWILDQVEAQGLRSIFYFITRKCGKYDASYDLFDPRIIKLLTKINERGHEVGLHGSYLSHEDTDIVDQELNLLQEAVKKAGFKIDKLHCRQHYLRWNPKLTLNILNKKSIATDSSVSYSEKVGFRTGCCYPHKLWDFRERVASDFLEMPLSIMDDTLLCSTNMNLSQEEAQAKIIAIKNRIKKYGGQFVFLWHPETFYRDPRHHQLFELALKG